MSNYLVEMKGIVKRFPGVVALDHVDFQLAPGEVHMLLGENGAGKSTLIKVLSGAYTCDEGEIFIKGEKVDISSPLDALNRNLRFIYQELNLVPEMDVARNMFLGLEPLLVPGLGVVNKRKLYELARTYLASYHMDLDPREPVENLSVTQQKMIEIAKALVAKVSVLVLDEPTDVLEDQARNELFDIIRRLKSEQEIGFVYISHRYAEVHQLGDRVTILRDGSRVGTWPIADISLDTIIEKMTGGKSGYKPPETAAKIGEAALSVRDVVRRPRLNGISLEVRKGEIVAVTGLMGSGKTELARAIAGIDRLDSGSVHIDGKEVRSSDAADGIRNGIAYMTENRKTEGLILGQTIQSNYALPSIRRLSPMGLVDFRSVGSEIDALMKKLQIKASGRNVEAGHLSGGNQQKVVLAKWLGTACRVLLVDEPTRGIDINGRAEVYRILEELLAEGVAVVMFTSDYLEAMTMGNRVVVLHRGAIAREFARGEATEEDILRVAIGGAGERVR
ncbi:MAG: sugar ABC transporter ATP-binding protein [Spirochaetia bacterium]|jgi:ribose transport system ATP-binding protein